MVFSSNIFMFLFLPLTLVSYFLIDKKYKNTLLLIVSLGFYAWGEPKYVFLMMAVVLFNYICGLVIDNIRNKSIAIRRLMLTITVVGNLSALFYFKYFDFFISSINSILNQNFQLRNIVLPIGISFYTFQAMSYTLDLYLGKVTVQKSLWKLMLYVSLFPQLIAGPIVRYKDVCDEIEDRTVTIDTFAVGVRRFAVGLAKKIIIADQLGYVADQIFGIPANENLMATAWAGAICYLFQIYFDFSGYSDMAIGLGKMFGFNFLENFNYPYISTSITEFWRRWHISLSSWFKDYVYIPLGGNRKGNVYFNLLVVFLVTGLWHGAEWSFVLWGLWHGFFLIVERIFKSTHINLKIPIAIKWVYTMIIVLFGWVLFRAADLEYALEYIGVMLGLVKSVNVGFEVGWYLNTKVILFLGIAIVASTPIKNLFIKYKDKYSILVGQNLYSVVLLIISVMFIITSTYTSFIYFRF